MGHLCQITFCVGWLRRGVARNRIHGSIDRSANPTASSVVVRCATSTVDKAHVHPRSTDRQGDHLMTDTVVSKAYRSSEHHKLLTPGKQEHLPVRS